MIAEELVRIDDEALEHVSITTIDVDPEMNRAIVYFDSLVGEMRRRRDRRRRSPSHRVRLQSVVGRQIRAKKTPILEFRPDEVIRRRGAHRADPSGSGHAARAPTRAGRTPLTTASRR